MVCEIVLVFISCGISVIDEIGVSDEVIACTLGVEDGIAVDFVLILWVECFISLCDSVLNHGIGGGHGSMEGSVSGHDCSVSHMESEVCPTERSGFIFSKEAYDSTEDDLEDIGVSIALIIISKGSCSVYSLFCGCDDRVGLWEYDFIIT